MEIKVGRDDRLVLAPDSHGIDVYLSRGPNGLGSIWTPAQAEAVASTLHAMAGGARGGGVTAADVYAAGLEIGCILRTVDGPPEVIEEISRQVLPIIRALEDQAR